MRVRRAAAALAAALCAGLPAFAAQAADALPKDVRVAYLPATAAGTARLLVSGRAPLRCAPALEHAQVDGNDISIALSQPRAGCGSQTTAFRFAFDPVASAGVPLAPNQVYRVRVYLDDDGGTSSLASFGLLGIGAAASSPVPENGFWWPESTTAGSASIGNGLTLEQQDGKLAVGLFGFDDRGAATWYFGSAPLDGSTARVPLVQLADGDGLFSQAGNRPSASAGPRLELELLSPTRMRAWLVRSDGGRDVEVRAMNLSRTHFATAPTGAAWSGQWVLVADDGGAPALFDLADASSPDGESFRLADAARDATLDCRTAADAKQVQACTLTVAAAALADFDQVGFDRLSGHGQSGQRITLMRVPR